MQYTYSDFLADKPRLVAAVVRVRATGLTAMNCCFPRQWLQELAEAAGLPVIPFAKRGSNDLDLRVSTVTRGELMSPRTLSVYAAQAVQPALATFLYPTSAPVPFEGQPS
jgi:hypothetical protein